MTWQQDFPVSSVRQASSLSLPLLPGIANQNDFASRYQLSKNVPRQYRDARSRLAGYQNYREWIETREEEGTKRGPKFKGKYNGEPNLFIFYNLTPKTKEIHFKESTFKKHNRDIEMLLKNAPEDRIVYIVALLLDAKYGNNCDTPIDNWSWVTPLSYTPIFGVWTGPLHKAIYEYPEMTYLENVLLSPDFGVLECPGNKVLHMGPHHGIAEMHILFFNPNAKEKLKRKK